MQILTPLAALAIILVIMLVEQRHSVANERALRLRGAVEARDDVYPIMQWAYPASFVVMAIEGALAGPAAGAVTLLGVVVLVAAKILKVWAITALGDRWTFRVLVPPDSSLVTHGPYVYVRHPNYVAVVGELIGFALVAGARISGPAVTLLFGLLLLARIRTEEHALRHPPCT
jgi:methyltransferase